MQAKFQLQAQKELKEQVIKNDLCTGCGACVHLCPYFEHYRDKTVILHECDGADGRCYAYCPRTPVNLSVLREKLFSPADWTVEIGPVKGFFMTRARDQKIRDAAQHGGTVSALMTLALSEGIIDAAVLAGQKENLLSESITTSDSNTIASRGKSKFVVSPTVALFNDAAKGPSKRIGLVATPCQALALAKMRGFPKEGDEEKAAKLKLVIGLFCGWALSWEALKPLLDQKFGATRILKVDIPPSKHHCMEVTTEKGIVEIPLSEVEKTVRKNCSYCFDMTCEFSDISVGSARSPEGWAVDKGWNQVIVRSDTGQALLELARVRGILEFKPVPDGNLEKLKSASMNKKRNCVRHLSEKSGQAADLIYLDRDDPAVIGCS
ncbi:MAG: Coenzyme F420 hydrogenase/dehydrogenase, beta subunit C-terminal domain [Pseudomonadota bacterium]